MIQVPAKSLNHADIPKSIRLPLENEANIPSVTTHERRKELILANKYIKGGIYDSRYKQEDVKEALQTQYKNKCAFCEQYSERWDVEHYRPKAIYYWLTYSWDNLLYACPTCNVHKSDNFELIAGNNRLVYNPTDLPQIHQLCQAYNSAENPKLLHPEYDNAEPLLVFSESGLIRSNNERANYTIQVCKLDRKKLNQRRKKIFDKFVKKFNAITLQYSSDEVRLQERISELINDFAEEAFDEENEFLAYRRYILQNFISSLINS